jgi:hypothetical protein
MVDLDDGAMEVWVPFFNSWNEKMQEFGGAARAAYAKLEAYAARFALQFHCVRQVTGQKTGDYVDREDIVNGIALTRWFAGEMLRVYKVSTETDEEAERRELKALIRRLGGRATPREIKEHSRKYPTSEAAEAAIERLLVNNADGSWDIDRTGKRGRPPTHFVLAESPDWQPTGAGGIGDGQYNGNEFKHRNVAQEELA